MDTTTIITVVLATITGLLLHAAYKKHHVVHRLKRPHAPQQTLVPRRRYSWKPAIKWGVVIVVTIVGVSLWSSKDDGGPTLVATRAWSDKIRVSVGKLVLWERRENASYAIRTQDGKLFRFPRDPIGDTRTACEKHIWIPGTLSEFQIIVTDTEIDEVGFDLAFYPYEEGGPCKGVEYVPPAPEQLLPRLQEIDSGT